MAVFQRKFSAAVLACLLLCGCTTPERAAQLAAKSETEKKTEYQQAVQVRTTRSQALETFLAAAEQLEAMGITGQEERLLLTKLGERELSQLAAGQIPEHLDLLALPHAWPERMKRYLALLAKYPDLSLQEVVTWVNTGLDTPFYTDEELVEEPENLRVLANKYHALPEDYVPQLVDMDDRYTAAKGAQLQPMANLAFMRMADAAARDGIRLFNVSAYRSYAIQEIIYNNYVAASGQAYADTYSARPGHSEHQTGLALDVNTASELDGFENTKTYAWLQEHCADYGFILRYPQGKTSITGYAFEPWHYRYLGVEEAKACQASGLTYDQYVASQPVKGPYAPPAVYVGSRAPKELSDAAVAVDGVSYVPASLLAQAMDWSWAQGSGMELVISGQNIRIQLLSDSLLLVNGIPAALDHPVFLLDEEIMVPVEAMAKVIGMECSQAANGTLYLSGQVSAFPVTLGL